MNTNRSSHLIRKPKARDRLLVVFTAVFLVMFSYGGYRLLRQSGASGDCIGQEPIRLLIPPTDSDKFNRIIVSSATNKFPTRRSYSTNKTMVPGEYEIYSIASDDHYLHRSASPTEDVQPQPREEYYISINGNKTPRHSTDFTDYYDWRGSVLIQDDDNQINTIPPQMETDPGEYLGNITLSSSANSVEFIHVGEFDASARQSPNSIIPGAVIVKCVRNLGPSLSLTKAVDGNNDGVFRQSEEIRPDGTPFVWQLVGTNNGSAGLDNARIVDDFPAGTVVQSVRVVNGGGMAVTNGNSIVWNGSLAKDESVTINVTLKVQNAAAFATCDNDTNDGNVPNDKKCFNKGRVGVATPNDPEGIESPVYASSDVTSAAPAQLSIEKKVDANKDGTFTKSETMSTFGSEVKWRLSAKNNGGTATEAVIRDVLSEGVEGLSVNVVSGGGTASLQQNVVSWTGTLGPDQTVVIELLSKVNNEADFAKCDNADTVTDKHCKNTSTISMPINGTNTEVASDSAEIIAQVPTSVNVLKQVDANNDGTFSSLETAPVEATPFSWKFTITNNSAYEATNIRAVDKIIAGNTYVSGSASASRGTISDSGGIIIFNGNIPAGQSVVVTYRTSFANRAAFDQCDSDTTIANTVASDNRCSNEVIAGLAVSDNQNAVEINGRSRSVASVSRVLVSSLSIITLSDGVDDDNNSANQFSDTKPETIEAGKQFLWQMRGINSGEADENEARLAAAIPSGVQLVGKLDDIVVSGVDGGKIAIENEPVSGQKIVVWTGNLPKGSMVTITFPSQINNKADYQSCTSKTTATSCSLTGIIGKKDAGNIGFIGATSQDPAFVVATFAPLLAIEKSVDAQRDGSFEPISDKAIYQKNILWQVRGFNNGNDSAASVSIVDVLPAGTRRVTATANDIVIKLDKATTTKITIVDNYEDGRPAIVWTGTIDVQGIVDIQYETVYDNEAAYSECLSKTSINSLCGTAAKIGLTDPLEGITIFTDTNDAAILIEPIKLSINKQVSAVSNGSWAETLALPLNDSLFDDGLRPSGTSSIPTTEQGKYYYRLRITNGGTSPVKEAALLDSLPDGVIASEIISVSPSGLGTAEIVSGTRFAVFWHTSELAAGQSAEVVFSVSIADKAAFTACDETKQYNDTKDGVCVNYALAGVGTKYSKFESKANPDSASVTVEPAPVILMQKTIDGVDADNVFTKQEEIRYTEKFRWRIELSNSGNLEANLITVQDKLPAGLTFVSIDTFGDTDKKATFDTATSTVNWSGAIAVDKKIAIELTTSITDEAAFKACDDADSVKNDVCANSASITYKNQTRSSSAVAKVANAPTLSIIKLVDADLNGTFSESEKMQLNRSVSWRVTVKNTGSAPAYNAKFADTIIEGMTVQAGTISEIKGAEYGTPTLADSVLSWQGTIPAQSEITVEFKTTFTSMQQFATCNLSDGKSTDQLCTNSAKVGYVGLSQFLSQSSASINTDLPVVLAYTGQSPTRVLILIALPSLLVLLALFELLKRTDKNAYSTIQAQNNDTLADDQPEKDDNSDEPNQPGGHGSTDEPEQPSLANEKPSKPEENDQDTHMVQIIKPTQPNKTDDSDNK